MPPINPYSLFAAACALAAGWLWRPGIVGALGLLALALAVHVYVWDSERKEVFDDDWVVVCHALGSLGLLVLGGVLLSASVLT